MKHHTRGDQSSPKRSRRRGKASAADTPSISAADNANGASSDVAQSSLVGENGQGFSAAEAALELAATTASAPNLSLAAPAVNEAEPERQSVAAPTPSGTSRENAEKIVQDFVPLAVGAGMIPFPGVDLAAIAGLQLKLLASLAKQYGVPFSTVQAKLIVTSLLGSVGTTVLAGSALVSLAKLVPFVGTLVGVASMPIAGGVVTRAMGQLAIDHFEAGGTMENFDLDVAQEAFLGKIAEAKAALA